MGVVFPPPAKFFFTDDMVFSGVSILESDDSAITMELELQWDGNPNIVLDIQTTLGISLPVQVICCSYTLN